VAGDSPAQPGGPRPAPAPGSLVAGYLLEEAIWPGGLATVFRARDERLGRTVALKLLRVEPGVESRFLHEARAVAALDHPSILPVYEAGEAGPDRRPACSA
jgi:serine/threonine protein kinase